ncbi:MAG TPA: hypothetical protein VM818_01865 [Vicinamibacterales bacterium]|nr:hypothetical protein [Vicinamibacterales bacterium]
MRTRWHTIVIGILALSGSPSTLLAQAAPAPLRLTAFAVNMSNIATGANSQVIIQIDRWSSAADRDRLKAVFLEKGPERLLDAVQNSPRVGFVRLPTSLGWDLRYAQADPLEDGGQRIVILTDRPIGSLEARNQPRTRDYPFTLIQIQLDRGGRGDGRMSVATKFTYDVQSNSVVLENYSTEPVRLQNVQVNR